MDPLFVKVLPNVFSAEECLHLIKTSEQRGYTPAVINRPGGREVFDPGHRDSDRVIIDDPELAKTLLSRLQPHLLPLYQVRALAGVNERMRFLKYSRGQRFRQHSDGCYINTDGSQRSLMTLMLYMSNIEWGGETLLYTVEDSEVPHLSVACKPGQVLLFDHDWYQESAPVAEGLKYCMRTDVMYES